MSDSQSLYGRIMNVQPLELVDSSIGKRVHILTRFGYEFEGTLNGYDPAVNVVLLDATETFPCNPDFEPRTHSMILINGMSISLVFFISNSR